jgi:cytochrome c oxidase subunit IV
VAEATTATAHSKAGHRDHGTKRYFIVWAILLACTLLTVWSGYKDLGSYNLPLALCIATFKATLVVLFFMHMTEAAGTNRLVFVTSFVFMMVMIFGVFGDLWTRSEMSLPNHVPSTEGPEITVPEGATRPEGMMNPPHHE